MKKLIKKILDYNLPREVIEWRTAEGDKTLRLNYDLNENSMVFDVGGYEGQWSSDIYAKFNCNIYIFEPIAKYAEKIKARFAKNHKIMVYPMALTDETKDGVINYKEDGSSLYGSGGEQIQIKQKSIKEFLLENEIVNIDLMKINCEGGEYPLLEQLLNSGLISRVYNLQIQFHKISVDSEGLREKISSRLEETHRLTWNYPFVWENWKKK